jgi:hypothetical protein
MIVPSRVTRKGYPVPSFEIDDEFAERVLSRKWTCVHGYIASLDNSGQEVRLHRFVWAIRYGSAPERLDHINRDKTDNRLENLRPATHALNMTNTAERQNASGLPRGVCLMRRGKPYAAQIWRNGKKKQLGVFDTPEEASAAYEKARAEHVASEELKSEKLFTPKEKTDDRAA